MTAEPDIYEIKQARFDFKVDPDNGMLIGPAGCHYDTKAEAMYYDHLGLCGCGCPEAVHQLIFAACVEFSSARGEDYDPISRIAEIVKQSPDVAAEFIAHFLDQKHLIEHGGSVYGAWLTERGKQFVEIGATWE